MRCLISLIEAAPFLHKFELVVRALDKVKKIKESELDVMWTRMREHPNKYIKEVEMVDFRAGEAHAGILAYLLKNAVMLEKLVIDTSRVFLGKGHYRALSRRCHYKKMQIAKDNQSPNAKTAGTSISFKMINWLLLFCFLPKNILPLKIIIEDLLEQSVLV